MLLAPSVSGLFKWRKKRPRGPERASKVSTAWRATLRRSRGNCLCSGSSSRQAAWREVSFLDGFVSTFSCFGNPLDNQWYQIVVENGVVKLRNLGEIKSTRGKSLREIVDRAVRRARKSERYRTKPAVLTAMATGINPRLKETSTGRAKLLREQIKKLK